MTIHLTADAGIPLPTQNDRDARLAYVERARAAVLVMKDLFGKGAKVPEVSEEDRQKSRTIALERVPNKPFTESDAPMLLHLDALLTRYDFELLDSARRLNNYVVNKLLEETTDDDPRIRLRALELLGKTSTAKVFSENVNVNVTHRTAADVEQELAAMAARFMGTADVVDADFTPALPAASDDE